VSNSLSTTNFTSYDQFGNVLASSQPTNSLTNSFSYTYNLASKLIKETYPSGRAVTYAYDVSGAAKKITNIGGFRRYQ